MRILHAADLHLGRSLHERDLIPDQRVMLDAMLRFIVERNVDVLVVAGDIYDRAIPQPEAISLFDDFLSAAAALRDAPVLIAIPGNHDSAARLSFGAGFFRRAGFHIRSRPEDLLSPIVVERHGEVAAFWALPWLGPGAFRDAPTSAPTVPPPGKSGLPPSAQAELFEADPGVARVEAAELRSQAELFAEAVRRLGPALDPVAANVLVAHCFAAGGSPSETERSFIGGAEEVPTALFEGFDYVALGHLHRRQSAGPRARYPGSPLAYSFDEAIASPEKGFLLVDVQKGGFSEDFLVFPPLHRLSRLEGDFATLSEPGACAGQREDFVEVRLTDPLPVLDPADPLRANFPNLLSVRQAAFEISPAAGGEGGPGLKTRARGEGSDAVLEDFRAFHAEMMSAPAEAATEALLLALLKEAEHASA